MKKIYIIDDEIEMTDSISMILESEGYATACQNDDKNVVTNLIAFKPDLIILDVMFPGNDSAGFEIARLVKQNNDIKSIPILMLTGINKQGGQSFKFSDGDKDEVWMPVSKFVDKPVNPEVLLKKVKELVA